MRVEGPRVGMRVYFSDVGLGLRDEGLGLRDEGLGTRGLNCMRCKSGVQKASCFKFKVED